MKFALIFILVMIFLSILRAFSVLRPEIQMYNYMNFNGNISKEEENIAFNRATIKDKIKVFIIAFLCAFLYPQSIITAILCSVGFGLFIK